MPIFEYVCAECGHKFEKLVLSASREREIRCPECRSESVAKAISACCSRGSGGATTGASAGCAPSG